MATIKKKDLNKYKAKSPKPKKIDLDELVDADGSPIEGDRNPVNNSEIETAPQQTTDDFANSAIQPNRYFYGLGGTAYSHGQHIQAESEKNRVAEEKMKKIIEDLTNKSGDREMVKRYKDNDVNRNEIPDLEELSTKYQKPIVAKKAQELLKTFEMNQLTGEEIGIVINYILTNINIADIPMDYKSLLRKSI